jgi:NAD(P)-dependent dehydrogenase (short-subunit alcohol dehydrogenase family)
MHRIGTSERPDLPLAVVVGAGALGAAIARRLALSHRVLLADVDGPRAESRAAAMRDEGCDASSVACDITSPQAVDSLAKEVAARGGLGALAQVAGLSPSAADFRSIIRVNLTGAALVAEALRPLAGRGSAAVLVSSLAAHSFQPAPEVAELLREAAAADLAERLEAAMGENATPQLAYPISKWGMNLYCRRQAAAWGEM